jgi:hypothetical protein
MHRTRRRDDPSIAQCDTKQTSEGPLAVISTPDLTLLDPLKSIDFTRNPTVKQESIEEPSPRCIDNPHRQ